MTATLIGMLLTTQVASSWLVIWKQPSPSMAQTARFGSSNLCAHRGRDREAHGAQPGGVHPLVWTLVLHKLCAPHLVLTHTGDVDRFGTGDFRGGLP